MDLVDRFDLKDNVVFIINDDKTQLKVLSGILRNEQVVVHDFDDSENALNALYQIHPDLVISDLNMPGIDGWQLCRLLRSPEYHLFNNTPILIVSATFSGDDTSQISTSIGADAFLSSPVDGVQFLETVRVLLSGGKLSERASALIAEIDPEHAKTVSDAFISQDYSVETANGIAPALSLIQERPFNIVLINHRLIDGDGERLLEAIHQTHPGTVCLMMTSDSTPELAMQWLKLGAAAYLRKPFTTEYLIELCERVRRERSLFHIAEVLDKRTEQLRVNQEQLASSHQVLAGILENTHVLVAFLDPQFNFVWVNQAYAQADYQTSDYFVGKNYFDLYQNETTLATFKKVVETGESYSAIGMEFKYQRQQEKGKTYWDWSLIPIKDQKNSVTGLTLTLSETTKQTIHSKQLQESERNFRNLFESMTDMIFASKVDGRVLFANAKAIEALEYDLKELQNMKMLDLYAQQDRVKANVMLSEAHIGEKNDDTLHLVTEGGVILPVGAYSWHGQWNGEDCLFFVFKDLTPEYESQHRFISLFRSSPVPTVLTKIEDSKFAEVNEAFARITGYSREEVIGKTTRELKFFTDEFHIEKIAKDVEEHGYSRNEKLKIRRKDGKEIDGLFSGEVVVLDGKQFFLTMMVDISDLKMVENAMRELLLRQQALLEAIPDIIMEVDQQLNYTWANKAGFDFFGNDVVGKEAQHYFIGEQNTYDTVKSIFKSDENVSYVESWQRRRDGEKRLLAWWFRVYKDADGNVIGALSSARDITEAKIQEEDLRLRSMVLDQIQDQVTITDLDGVITYVNQAEERKLGRTGKELIGQRTQVYGEDKTKGASQNEILTKTKENGSWRGEVVNFAADGSELFMDCRTHVVHDEHGEPMALCGIATDITDQKRTEYALRESEAKFRSITEQTSDMIALTDNRGIITYCSPASKEIFHYSPEEMCGKSYTRFLDESEIPKTLELFRETFENGLTTKFLVLQMKRKDGSLFDGEISGSRFSGGGCDEALVVIRDISERVKANKKIRMSQQRLRLFIDASPDMYFLKDCDRRYMLVNNANAEFFGLSKEDIIGKTDEELMPIENAKGCRATDIRAMTEKKTILSVEQVGGQIYETRKLPVIFNNEIIGVAGIIRDITEPIRAEEALRESEENFRHLFENAPVGVFRTSSKGIPLIINKTMANILGFDSIKEGLEHYTDLGAQLYLNPEKRKEFLTLLKRDGVVENFEYEALTYDKRRIWLVNDARIKKGDNEDDFEIEGFASDITERIRAVEALRASEETYRALLEGLPDIIFRFDREGRHLFASESVEKIVGFPALGFLGKTHRELGFSEEQSAFCERQIEIVFETREIVETEINIDGIKGPTIFNWRLVPEFNQFGEMVSVLSVSRDISEQRRLEQSYKQIFNEMLNGFSVHEIVIGKHGKAVDYRFIAVNPAFERITGLKADEVIGKNVKEVLPFTEEYWIEMYGKVAQSGEPVMFSNYSQDLDKYFEVASFRTGVNQFATVFSDITDRKRAEEALRESELKVRKKLQAVLDPEDIFHELELSDLLDIDMIQDLMDNLFNFTNVAMALADLNGNMLVATGWQDICTKYHRVNEETRKHCYESDVVLSSGVASGEVKAYKCKNNMWDIVTPIIIGGEHLGNLFLGQFFYDDEEVDYNFFRGQARKYGFDETGYMDALNRVPRWSRSKVNNMMEFYSQFAAYISTLSYSNIKLARTLEMRKRAEEEREHLREQLVQALKMESIGRLAGGVAHDLNNLLSPILGYSELMLGDFSPDDTRRQSIEEIMQAGLRARNVVRQLLAFSRRQTLEYKTLDMNQIISSFEKLLRHTIREDVKIVINLSDDLSNVKADIGQIEQVIMNLSVNAQDAMPNGGILTLETKDTELDENYTSTHSGIEPGRYVMLAISDTGTGMDEETRKNIFEPFFSTKGEQGTGLGLSTVYGIIKQHGGSIWVYSEPGNGSTFKIYLPAAGGKAQKVDEIQVTQSVREGNETILLAEDNEQVRHLAQSILKRQGYNVLSAVNGTDAVRVFTEYNGHVDLLLTDVIMPDINGKELYDSIALMQKDIKVLYMSGYTTNVIAHKGILDEGIQFIQKPFTVRGLAQKIRELLNA